ncbi:MAG: hypothetical protein RIE56_05950 [Amphiplicatus sp.]
MKHLLIWTTLAGAAASPAFAQGDPIEVCRNASETDAARILCLENAIRALTSGAPKQSAAAVASEGNATLADGITVNDEVTGLGAEQVKRRQAAKEQIEAGDNEPVEIAAEVTEVAYTSLGKAIFFLDNGQIWRQKNADKNNIRLSGKRDYTAVISEGMLSGYRLTVNELKRTVLVERIK